VLLAGGNPRIAKGYGEGPVLAWLDAVPGWKGDVARWLDALIVQAVPGVWKAVKWNSPLCGMREGAWFLSLHCFNAYVKVAFFKRAALRPPPPGASKQADVRYLDVRESGLEDEGQFIRWVEEASRLPGERM
jgi:hypothetical protein